MTEVCLVLVDEDQGETSLYVDGRLDTDYMRNDELGHYIKLLSPCTVTVREYLASDLAYVEEFGLPKSLEDLVDYVES